MILLNIIHTLFDFGSEIDVVEAISQAKTGESINSFGEWEHDSVPQTLLYKAATCKKRLILEALIKHPLIDVDMSKAGGCPLLKVISAGDYKSVCIILRHPGYIPKDWQECFFKAFSSKDTRIMTLLMSHACTKDAKQTIRARLPAHRLQSKPAPPAGQPSVRPPQPPPPPLPGTLILIPPQQEESQYPTAMPAQATPPLLPLREDSPVRTAQEWSWLAVRLHKAGFDYHLVRDCERKLIAQEGFMSAALFATLPAAELTFAYLDNIGIAGKGLQLELMQVHRALQPTTSQKHIPEQKQCQHENTAVMQETLRELTKSNALLQQSLQNQQCVISQLAERLATM